MCSLQFTLELAVYGALVSCVSFNLFTNTPNNFRIIQIIEIFSENIDIKDLLL